MSAQRRSLDLTDRYRERLLASRDRLQALAAQRWPTIEQLDGTGWPDRMAASVAQAQLAAVRATGAYLTAFLSSETGKRQRGPQIDSRAYAGLSRDGRPLTESLRSPLIGVLAALKEGKSSEEALSPTRATRMVGDDFDHAHRSALLAAIDSDERFDGWERAVRGTCGACAGVAIGPSGGLSFPVHPNCGCVSEPRVRGVTHISPRLTGAEIFAAKSAVEQDEMLGPDAAARVRDGLPLSELVETSPLKTAEDFITQKPLHAVTT